MSVSAGEAEAERGEEGFVGGGVEVEVETVEGEA